MSLAHKVHVVTLLDQNKQSVLEDGSDLCSTAKEWTRFFDRFDESLHRDCVVELVSDDRRTLAVSATDSFSLKGYFSVDVSQLDHDDLVVGQENSQRIRLDLEDVTEALMVVEKHEISDVVDLSD